MKKRTLTFIVILGGLLLWGCYPGGAEYTDEFDIVVTHHNPEYDFTAKGTYAMPSEIVKITGNVAEGDDPEFLPPATSSQILSWIDQNMSAYGWTKVDLDSEPDVILLPASWETTTVYYYYDYWYWWYGGYYPPYGGYYPPVYVSSYTTGTLLMTIKDPEQLSGTGAPISQWTGAINGILNSAFNPARVKPLVDKAFEQSAYLKTN